MLISLNANELKNVIFIYDNNPLLDIYKCVKLIIDGNHLQLINMYKNNYIINRIPINNANYLKYEFLCYIEDIKSIFSVMTEETKLFIKNIDEYFMYFSNDGSDFKIPILPDDFPQLPVMTSTSYKIELNNFYESLKYISLKSNNELSGYTAIKVYGNKVYALNTDNYRIHSAIIELDYFLPSFSFVIHQQLMDYIGKYSMDLYIGEGVYILRNNYTTILLEDNTVVSRFKKAFAYLDFINSNEYINKFTVNKSVFLNELKKHIIFSKDLYIHLKPHTIILYSKSDKILNSDIKTISHAYDLDFNEHQTILIDAKYFIDFIKAHKENTVTIYINDKNLVYSQNNLCATKRM